ncbi:proline-rich protein 36-like [Saccopteryx bilineata]|uniref:proline-rich protein 36-like n=1 Tax=Saccopteryx bilineata TaxID=59482 RepID=UPI00338FA948
MVASGGSEAAPPPPASPPAADRVSGAGAGGGRPETARGLRRRRWRRREADQQDSHPLRAPALGGGRAGRGREPGLGRVSQRARGRRAKEGTLRRAGGPVLRRVRAAAVRRRGRLGQRSQPATKLQARNAGRGAEARHERRAEEGGEEGTQGLGERSLEAEQRHGAAPAGPGRGLLPAPAPSTRRPACAEQPREPRPDLAASERLLPPYPSLWVFIRPRAGARRLRAGSAYSAFRGELGGSRASGSRRGQGQTTHTPGGTGGCWSLPRSQMLGQKVIGHQGRPSSPALPEPRGGGVDRATPPPAGEGSASLRRARMGYPAQRPLPSGTTLPVTAVSRAERLWLLSRGTGSLIPGEKLTAPEAWEAHLPSRRELRGGKLHEETVLFSPRANSTCCSPPPPQATAFAQQSQPDHRKGQPSRGHATC